MGWLIGLAQTQFLKSSYENLIFGKIGFLKLKVCSQSCLPTLHRTTVNGRPLRLHQQEYQQSHHQPPSPHLLHLVQLLQP